MGASNGVPTATAEANAALLAFVCWGLDSHESLRSHSHPYHLSTHAVQLPAERTEGGGMTGSWQQLAGEQSDEGVQGPPMENQGV